MINLEHPEGAEQVRAPPRERVKPSAQNDVLREGASSQPILGVPAPDADSGKDLADDLGGEQRNRPLAQFLPGRSDEHQGERVVQHPRLRRLQTK